MMIKSFEGLEASQPEQYVHPPSGAINPPDAPLGCTRMNVYVQMFLFRAGGVPRPLQATRAGGSPRPLGAPGPLQATP